MAVDIGKPNIIEEIGEFFEAYDKGCKKRAEEEERELRAEQREIGKEYGNVISPEELNTIKEGFESKHQNLISSLHAKGDITVKLAGAIPAQFTVETIPEGGAYRRKISPLKYFIGKIGRKTNLFDIFSEDAKLEDGYLIRWGLSGLRYRQTMPRMGDEEVEEWRERSKTLYDTIENLEKSEKVQVQIDLTFYDDARLPTILRLGDIEEVPLVLDLREDIYLSGLGEKIYNALKEYEGVKFSGEEKLKRFIKRIDGENIDRSNNTSLKPYAQWDGFSEKGRRGRYLAKIARENNPKVYYNDDGTIMFYGGKASNLFNVLNYKGYGPTHIALGFVSRDMDSYVKNHPERFEANE